MFTVNLQTNYFFFPVDSTQWFCKSFQRQSLVISAYFCLWSSTISFLSKLQKKNCQSSNQKYYLLNTEKYFQKQQTNICRFYRKYNFVCAISLLISSKTTEKNLWMITNKNMQKLLKIVFGMNHRIILFESTEKKISLSADWL